MEGLAVTKTQEGFRELEAAYYQDVRVYERVPGTSQRRAVRYTPEEAEFAGQFIEVLRIRNAILHDMKYNGRQIPSEVKQMFGIQPDEEPADPRWLRLDGYSRRRPVE